MKTYDPTEAQRWPKVCSCSASYNELSWEQLEYVGVQRSEFDGMPDLELRNCRCGSTITVRVLSEFDQ